ncbi:recombinase family protein [Comamonas suwonensis]|uniref:recombinase family protein n=1 Tax=Comamonas suwonensis TaxID=2606214 RepID=UPI00145EE19E|nr:recombinase family protein [Comamonas suwonensis]MBI1625084.1 recombinase family protein [Comamonas suwonensis]
MTDTADLPSTEINPDISSRTRRALADARERGVKLGTAGAANIRATVEKRKSAADAFAKQHEALFAQLQEKGLTHRAMAAELNALGITAAKGGEWTHGQVQRILNRYADWVKVE